MNIAVLVKPVPDPAEYHRITIDPETKRLRRDEVPAVINPADKAALEQALQIKEALGGEVAVYAMAPPEGREKLRECLAMGADKAFLVSDRRFGGADTWATAYTLAEAVKQTGAYDLILGGNESADGATGHVPTQVGEFLGISHLTTVKAIFPLEEGFLKVVQKREEGEAEYRVALPAVLGMTRDCQVPRYISAMGIIKSRKKPLTVLGREDLILEDDSLGLAGSPTRAGEIFTPDTGRSCKALSSDPEGAAEEILRLIDGAGIRRGPSGRNVPPAGGCSDHA